MVVLGLRDIHVAIDRAVADDYGWDDLDPDVGHYPTRIGVRWKVSLQVHFEVPSPGSTADTPPRADRPPLRDEVDERRSTGVCSLRPFGSLIP
jgi:hypothetical protein